MSVYATVRETQGGIELLDSSARSGGIHWIDMSENDELFSKIPANISSPAVSTETMSNKDWQEHQKARQVQFTDAPNAIIKTPYAFHARLQLEFELMPTSAEQALLCRLPRPPGSRHSDGAQFHDVPAGHGELPQATVAARRLDPAHKRPGCAHGASARAFVSETHE
jgi:hypothetical protein